VTLCDVSAPNGGGSSPSQTTGACPGTITYPSWYHATGLTQGPNIDNADTCNYTNGNCYVLTDRGTFNYLQTQNRAQNLRIVVRDNAAAARGGENFLVNSFHAYVLSPAKFAGNSNVSINVAGATAFLDWVTSPAGQAASKAFLAPESPFLPSASPALTGNAVPATVTAGTPVTVAGNLKNVVPGTPVLSGETVTVSTPAGAVASATTDAGGNYSITFTPVASGAFSVGTKQIAKVEDATLNPVFGDLLAPSSTSVGTMTVQSLIKVSQVTTAYRRATVSGTVAPDRHANGIVTISARKRGSRGALRNYAKESIGGGTYSIQAKLPPGSWEIQARFDDAGQVLSSVASTVTAKVPGASSVKVSRVREDAGDVTVAGSVSPAPSTTGGYVKLLARRGQAKFRAVGRKYAFAKGRRTYALHAHLSRGKKWQLRVEYVHKGTIDGSESKTRTLRVR
jgi:hypothetical protein